MPLLTNPLPSDLLSLYLVPSLAALATVTFGVSAYAVNPKRPTNQVLALFGFMSLVHFSAMMMGRHEGAAWWSDPAHHNPLPWVRAKWAALGFAPVIGWMLYYTVSGFYTSSKDLLLKMLPWFFVSFVLVAITFSVLFIPADSMPDKVSRGPLHVVYHIIVSASSILQCLVSIVQVKKLKGIKRLEFIQVNIAIAVYTLAGFLIPKLFTFSSFILYVLLAWSITSPRIYRTSRMLSSLVQNVVLLGILAAIATLAIVTTQKMGDNTWAIGAIIVISFAVWREAEKQIRTWLNLSAEQHLVHCGKELKQIGQEYRDPEKLVEELQKKLGLIGGTNRVFILRQEGHEYLNGPLKIDSSWLPKTKNSEEGWFSLSTQTRLITNPKTKRLTTFLEKENLPVLVWPRWTVNAPNIIVAFGVRENELPYTYPEIIVLRDLAEVVETIHTQAYFSLQAQQAEQLATIGTIAASAAHEIRQPLSAITAFSELVPKIIKNQDELEAWAKVLPGEGKRISSFVEQLLDLSKPRLYTFEPIELHEVIADTIKLTKEKATAREVRIISNLPPSTNKIMGDEHALRQVFLNLFENGIHALGQTSGPREINVRSKVTESHFEIEVTDNGPGIPSEIREKLFRPFVTKGRKGGFGLGLATCLNIMKAHKGTIAADKGTTERSGTTFRLLFPISDYEPSRAV